MSLKRSASAAGLPDDEAPCCWLCLEEGPDASGMPLVRDCSCRGTSGYAHLTCAVKYTESRCRSAYEHEEESSFNEYFRFCPNCKQLHQGDVQFSMVTAQCDFVEREYKNDPWLCLEANVDKLFSLDSDDEKYTIEGEKICSKILLIMEDIKKDPSLDHDDKVFANCNAYHNMADFYIESSNEKHLEKAKACYKRAQDLYKQLEERRYHRDVKIDLMAAEREIHKVDAMLSGNEPELDTTAEISYCRRAYKDCLEKFGESDLDTLDEGFDLFIALQNGDKNEIEAERFLSKLVDTSHRVHGIKHNVTEKLSAELQDLRVRQIDLVGRGRFQALRYESEGEKIVIQGPLPKCMDREGLGKRNISEEKTWTINNKHAIPRVGTPVFVHGLSLRSRSHLNGKIGVIGAYFDNKSICEIHFEEGGLESVKISRENVRILFGLPETNTKQYQSNAEV